MTRPRREFRANSLALEGRLLLAIANHNMSPPMVDFESGDTIQNTKGIQEIYQVATQQDGEATVTLVGFVAPGAGTVQVAVTTDPSSPAVGVNVGAVDQTLSFANGNSTATVTVPILAGAEPGRSRRHLDRHSHQSAAQPGVPLSYICAEDPLIGCQDSSDNRLDTGHTARNRADFQQTDEPGRSLKRE